MIQQFNALKESKNTKVQETLDSSTIMLTKIEKIAT